MLPDIEEHVMSRRLWTDEEMILTLDLYFKLTFGRLHHSTPEVMELARLIKRTANSVAIRLSNYASCDPYIKNSGRTGLVGGREKCLLFWNEYADKKEELFVRAAKIRSALKHETLEHSLALTQNDFLGAERETIIKQRVNQQAFRSMVLGNYNQRCAITGINIPELLIASHIIPWADDATQRLNPENGICLSPLYDKAFDKGLIGINTDYRIVLSEKLYSYGEEGYFKKYFASVENQKINLPEEHCPDKSFLEYHLQHIFLG